jgi:pyruvate/2-oxoglutarate/acetoin dehydrogenase E1 component
MTRQIKYSQAILEAIDQAMQADARIYLSENGMTGIAIGSAIAGMRPIIVHQKVDFFQLIGNGAKWHYLFGGQMNVPLLIRLQYSQPIQGFFAHAPGLKVVMPSNAFDAKGLMLAALEDNNPVIYLEHQSLYDTLDDVPKEAYKVPLGKAKIVREGVDVTLVASSYMVPEACKAAKWLEEEGVGVEVVDVRSLKPLDKETILASLQKTGRLIALDPDWKFAGFSSEILAMAAEEGFSHLKCAPVRIAYPERFCPASAALAKHFYPTSKDIVSETLKMLGRPIPAAHALEEMLQAKTRII